MRITFWLVLIAAWVTALSRPWGSVPALGPLLDLRSGVWQHREFRWQDQTIRGLSQPVQVAVDRAGVPHIFAQSEEDLYLAQGYIIASQRLFQIDLSTRSTSGRLSEWIGKKGAEIDRFFVRFGMRQSELESHQLIMQNPQTAMMTNQFVAGINEYVRQMPGLPLEYRLLGQTPQPFTSHIVSRMGKTMTYSLSGSSYDTYLSHLRERMSVEQILDLFPEFYPADLDDYVFPNAHAYTRGGIIRRRPETPDLFQFKTHLHNLPDIPQPPRFNGSNNWVVGPKKSKTGHSILANDTHLGLSLPNVWFENQLSCPQFNVYGVSFPAIPGIVNGFNQWTAWGPTNGGTDALDYYEIEFENETSPRYRSGNEWKEAKEFDEPIAGSANLKVRWSEWGPILHREGKYGLVARWTGHQPSNELATLRSLYSLHTARECLDAFRSWRVPIQNFVCADADHIGMIHAGWIGKRNVGEGRFIESAGQNSDHTLSGLSESIPGSDQPYILDPPEGYLRSANERTMGPEYPHYLGVNFEEPFRGHSIRRQLEAQPKFSAADLMQIQNDDYSSEAELILPILIRQVNKQQLSDVQLKALMSLARWDFRISADSVAATLYKQWYQDLKQNLFSNLTGLTERPNFAPRDIRVASMLRRLDHNPQDSDSQWVLSTKDGRTAQAIQVPITEAFLSAWSHLTQRLGPDPGSWTWSRWMPTQLAHIAHIPGLGSETFNMRGSSDTVNGNHGWHGAVYKFVIELGPTPKAWMQVPGGNNGDPLSPQFERFAKEWSRGEMREVEYYQNLAEARQRAVQVVEFTPPQTTSQTDQVK